VSGPDASIVIPTKDRREDLARCLDALSRQATERPWEVIVVDDGTEPPLRQAEVGDARLVRTSGGLGVGLGRNAGIEVASGRVIVCTDDDVQPAPGWLDACLAFLDAHADHVGVHGRTLSPPWDPLRAYSLQIDEPGQPYGCNVAYRRTVIDRLGGFSPEFRPYHGEDVDFAWRALDHGPIGYEPRMVATHTPREQTLRQMIQRSRFASHEVVVFRRHRERYGRAVRLPDYLFPYANIAVVWTQLLRGEGVGIARRPARLGRLLAIALGQAVVATRSLARLWWSER
jgi:GT2 family glycosyltransferase